MPDQFSWVRGLYYEEVSRQAGWDSLPIEEKIQQLDTALRALWDGYPEDSFPNAERWTHIINRLDGEPASKAR